MTDIFNNAGLNNALSFPLIRALTGRRSRRVFMGAKIPDGVLEFTSSKKPVGLSEVETLALVTAMAGNTAWHHMIIRADHYAPHLSNYACAAGGRVFPSGAGFETSQLFYTNDEGVYFVDTRDAPALVERGADGTIDFKISMEAHRGRIRKIREGRLRLPAREPHVDGHNTWVANQPGTTLLFPVCDLAQHVLAGLCFLAQNGQCMADDVNRRAVPGLEEFGDMVDLKTPLPLSTFEQLCFAECATEAAAACYAGVLMLQAMGMGGWMYNGISEISVLGAAEEAGAEGLGFRYDKDERWAAPNPTGLAGVFEASCPPHYGNMRAAVEGVCERKFGRGGPFNGETPGPWKDTRRVRGSAQVHDERFRSCVALMAQYVYDTFGKFPGTVPSIYLHMYVQAQHIDLEFYDRYFRPGAYLETHRRHMEMWHGETRKSH